MHKLIQPPMEPPAAVVWTEDLAKNTRSSMHQANTDAQTRKWKPIWKRKDRAAMSIADHDPLSKQGDDHVVDDDVDRDDEDDDGDYDGDDDDVEDAADDDHDDVDDDNDDDRDDGDDADKK